MHDGIYLSYLGLTELETKVLKSIFTLAPQLKENFALISPEQIEPFRENALSGLKGLAAKGDPVPMTRLVAMVQKVARRISPASRS